MKRFLAAAAAAALALTAAPAFAALKPGAVAPDFTAEGALGGNPFTFKLSDALAKGPVVVFFFPAAFTPGCTAEAKAFADAADEFAANGATLIGLTRGNVDRIAEFSKEHCRSKFPVAGVSEETMKAYDVVLAAKPDWTDRTSYVISPDGKVTFVHSAMRHDEHVSQTLAAVKEWKAKHGAN
ncbi:redoxin domain-containing protein [bacterium]|nr:redoxin domain-containing protein [bacterium]